ncbi:MAG: hypothetical protein IJ374_06260 [Lachnospiraceae bacterium]|nr:hypothetical protein [Lachnospiraceae bacterium]
MRKILDILNASCAPLIFWPLSAVVVYLLTRCSAETAVGLGLSVVGVMSVLDCLEYLISMVVQWYKFKRKVYAIVDKAKKESEEN